MARPESSYSKAVADKILDRMEKGEYVTAICKEKNMPGFRTLGDWRARHPEFAAAYAEARKAQALSHAERGLRIAMNEDPAFKNHDAHSRRLAFNALQWSASKLDPKNWGDRTIVSGDEDAPLLVETQRRQQLESLSYEERKAIEKILLAAAQRKERQEIEGDVDDE